MTGLLSDWANLLLRWTHFVAGIAWIGSSFYFIWLDRALNAPARPRPGVEGELWMVHSGGFYQTEKRRPGPGEMPAVVVDISAARALGYQPTMDLDTGLATVWPEFDPAQATKGVTP